VDEEVVALSGWLRNRALWYARFMSADGSEVEESRIEGVKPSTS